MNHTWNVSRHGQWEDAVPSRIVIHFEIATRFRFVRTVVDT